LVAVIGTGVFLALFVVGVAPALRPGIRHGPIDFFVSRGQERGSFRVELQQRQQSYGKDLVNEHGVGEEDL
jgi:hypothetical protein